MPGAEAVWSKNTVYEIQRTNSVFPPQRGGNSGFTERPLIKPFFVDSQKTCVCSTGSGVNQFFRENLGFEMMT
jgi:hypothetical protein